MQDEALWCFLFLLSYGLHLRSVKGKNSVPLILTEAELILATGSSFMIEPSKNTLDN